jgi:hypothetical protein
VACGNFTASIVLPCGSRRLLVPVTTRQGDLLPFQQRSERLCPVGWSVSATKAQTDWPPLQVRICVTASSSMPCSVSLLLFATDPSCSKVWNAPHGCFLPRIDVISSQKTFATSCSSWLLSCRRIQTCPVFNPHMRWTERLMVLIWRERWGDHGNRCTGDRSSRGSLFRQAAKTEDNLLVEATSSWNCKSVVRRRRSSGSVTRWIRGSRQRSK